MNSTFAFEMLVNSLTCIFCPVTGVRLINVLMCVKSQTGLTLKSTNDNQTLRFQVLMVASMKFRVFWDVAPYSHVEVDVGLLQRDYTSLHPRRL
jgi:hypothetical protein